MDAENQNQEALQVPDRMTQPVLAAGNFVSMARTVARLEAALTGVEQEADFWHQQSNSVMAMAKGETARATQAFREVSTLKAALADLYDAVSEQAKDRAVPARISDALGQAAATLGEDFPEGQADE